MAKGTVRCSPGFLLGLRPDPGVCSPQPALLNPAWICHHRVRGALGSGHRLSSPLLSFWA